MVGDRLDKEAILGMDFMVPERIHLNLADGTLCLPDRVRIDLAGWRPPYRLNISAINFNDYYVSYPAGELTEIRIGDNFPKFKL